MKSNTDAEIYLHRVDELLAKLTEKSPDRAVAEACFLGTLGIVDSLYGRNSTQARAIHDARKLSSSSNYAHDFQPILLGESLEGILTNIREEISGGLIRDLASEAAGEVIGDLVALAKRELQAGFTSVAAVLASAALEDALKRKASELGINVEGKTLDALINSLKTKSFFHGAQAPIVSSFIKLRNAAMHADWEKIQPSDVSGLLGFIEPFLLEHFS